MCNVRYEPMFLSFALLISRVCYSIRTTSPSPSAVCPKLVLEGGVNNYATIGGRCAIHPNFLTFLPQSCHDNLYGAATFRPHCMALWHSL